MYNMNMLFANLRYIFMDSIFVCYTLFYLSLQYTLLKNNIVWRWVASSWKLEGFERNWDSKFALALLLKAEIGIPRRKEVYLQ